MIKLLEKQKKILEARTSYKIFLDVTSKPQS